MLKFLGRSSLLFPVLRRLSLSAPPGPDESAILCLGYVYISKVSVTPRSVLKAMNRKERILNYEKI